jgi:hypothetical protein
MGFGIKIFLLYFDYLIDVLISLEYFLYSPLVVDFLSEDFSLKSDEHVYMLSIVNGVTWILPFNWVNLKYTAHESKNNFNALSV